MSRSGNKALIQISGLPASRTRIATAVEPIPDLTRILWRSSVEDLAGLIRHDPLLVDALQGAFPESLRHFDAGELNRCRVQQFGPRMLHALGYFNEVQNWSAVEATFPRLLIDRITADLLVHLRLPETQTLACTALVIILVKGLGVNECAGGDRKL